MNENNDRQTNLGTGAAALAGVSAVGLKKGYDSGDLTGRKTVYHSTYDKNLDSIFQNGLLKNKANGKTFTKTVLPHINEQELNDLVYVAKKKKTAAEVHAVRNKLKFMQDHPILGGLLYQDEPIENKLKDMAIIKGRVPIDLKKVDNPELLGAKNATEYIARFRKAKPDSFSPDEALRHNYINLKNNAEVYADDIAPKYLKNTTKFMGYGVKGKNSKYERETLKEIIEHIKKHPGKFGRGALLAGAPMAGAVALGVKANQKEASSIYDFMEKVAMIKNNE